MTIYNKEWLRSTIIRLYLSGLPQEEIASETETSEGTVNAVIQEAILEDNILKLQREVAIISKRTGVSVQQLASNLAFENSIKRLAFDKGKIDTFIKAIQNKFTQDGRLDPDLVAKIVLQIADMAMKKNLGLEELAPSIQRIYNELNALDEVIKNKKKFIRELRKAEIHALDKNNTTRKELNHSIRLRKSFENAGLDIKKEDEVKNVLSNIREMNFAVTHIIDELKEIRGLKDTKNELEQSISSLQNIALTTSEKIKELERNIEYLGPAKDTMIKLLQRGIHPDVITNIFDIVRKHPPAFLESLSTDIDTYGGTQAAIYYIRTEYNFLIDQVANLEAQRNALLNNNSYKNNVTDYTTNATRQNYSGDLLI